MSSTINKLQRLRRLAWSGGSAESLAATMVMGALAWGLYSAVQIAVNGVVLDESVLPGQIIANAVSYPAGHPHDVFYRQAYSLSHFMAAGMWWAGLDEIAISALRNWIFLFTSIMAVFSVTLALVRRPYWAHASVAVALLGAYLRFQGTYPLWVFPLYYSNGHIGLQLAVISGAVIAGGLWRTGGVLLGVMPAVHLTLSLAAWPWAFVYLWASRAYRSPDFRRRFVPALAVGLAVSLLLAALIVALPEPRPAASPYVGGIDGEIVRENYIALTDPHRQTLPVYTLGYLLNPAAFIALSMLLWLYVGAGATGEDEASRGATREGEPGRGATGEGEPGHAVTVAGLIAMGGMAWAIVYGAWLVIQLFGRLPDVAATAMPWRFSNVGAILLVPFTIVAIVGVTRRMREQEALIARLLLAATILGAGIAASPVVPMVGRDVVGNNLLVALWGILVGCAMWQALRSPSRRTQARVALAVVILAGAAAAFVAHTRIAIYLAFIAIIAVVVLSIGKRVAHFIPLRWVLDPVLILGIAVCSIAAMPDRDTFDFAPDRLRWDMISADDQRVSEWLRVNATPEDQILVAYYYPWSQLQAKAKQPVLLELETLQIMTYMSRLAPAIGSMVLDLYGVDYRDSASLTDECLPGRPGPWCDVWSRRWKERTFAEWKALGEKYRFRFVLAPAAPTLDLTPVVRGDHVTMYAIDEQ